MQTQTETERAYSAAKALGSPIGAADTDASKLTIEQTKALCTWADWQACSTFEDRRGVGFPLQAILDLWHASVVWETFDCWHIEEPRKARAAYVAVCKRHKIKHGA